MKEDAPNSKEAKRIMEHVFFVLKRHRSGLVLPLNVFRLEASEDHAAIWTDGLTMYFHPDYVVQKYRTKEEAWLRREVLHIVLHGMLGHFEIWEEYTQERLLSLIMDIQVERLMRMMGIPACHVDEDGLPLWDETLDEELDQYGFGSYYRALGDKRFFEKIKRLKRSVELDDHQTWMVKQADAGESRESENGSGGSGKKKQKNKTDKKGAGDGKGEIREVWGEVRECMFGKDVHNGNRELKELLTLSKGIMEQDGWGSVSGSDSQEICVSQESRNDYKELLRRIVNYNEIAKERDNIDYAIYQYGLSLYGDVPLIEPLECIEEKRFEHLVIAIDTSGSCSGDIMNSFICDTANILQELGAGIVFEGIHLLQCDTQIQCEACYDNPYQLSSAIGSSYRTFGFGGTDFQPVFNRVEQLRKEGKQINALLYFSDGVGDFPETKPEYPVYFILPPMDETVFCALRKLPDWVHTVNMK